MSKRLIVILTSATLSLSACADAAIESENSTSTSVGSTTTSVASTLPADGGELVAVIDPGLQSSIDRAVADLAQRLELPESDVGVQSAALVTWSDASLGCPEPNMAYAQALVDGALIELVVDEDVYSYHMGGATYEPFLCESPSPQGGVSGPDPLEGTPLELDKPIEKYPDETVPPPGYDE